MTRLTSLLSAGHEGLPAAGQERDRLFASDLNLDQIVNAVAGDRDERELIP